MSGSFLAPKSRRMTTRIRMISRGSEIAEHSRFTFSPRRLGWAAVRRSDMRPIVALAAIVTRRGKRRAIPVRPRACGPRLALRAAHQQRTLRRRRTGGRDGPSYRPDRPPAAGLRRARRARRPPAPGPRRRRLIRRCRLGRPDGRGARASTKTRTASTPSTASPRKPRAMASIGPEHAAEPQPTGPSYARCRRRVRTPPPVSSSTIRSPAGLRTGGAALGAGEGVEGGAAAAADRQPQRARGELEARPAVGAGGLEPDRTPGTADRDRSPVPDGGRRDVPLVVSSGHPAPARLDPS